METMTKTTTENKLSEMLTENTGRQMLDSGGAYGRNWERNQNVNFDKSPVGSLEFYQRGDDLDIVGTLSVYHFLKDRLEYNPELDKQYQQSVGENEYLDIHSAEAFAQSLDGEGIYHDDSGPVTVNTYNGEDMLSQVIQYVYWTDDDEAHILLQIHGGCDVCGGYTYPVAFDVAGYDETSIFSNADATIYCGDCNKHWTTDDAHHWYSDGCCGKDYKELNDYPTTDEKPSYPAPDDPAQATLFDAEREPHNEGVIWVDDNHNGHCPYCSGILKLSF